MSFNRALPNALLCCALILGLVDRAAAASLAAEVACTPKGAPLDLECRLTLREGSTRAPVSDKVVIVSADMPSMPGMHATRPVRAEQSGTDGVFLLRLKLEMAGRWALKVRVGEPPRTETVVIVEVGRTP
jgi:hypothetical protein